MREYRFTLATVGATFLLLLVGGLVNPTGSSLACPDWPLCYGSAFPEMKGGVLYEHSHRLLATLVGIFSIVMTILVLRSRKAPDDARTRLLTKLAVPLVLFQGVLGGVTVLLKLPLIVTLTHLVNSMLFFALLLTIAWRLRPGASEPAGGDPARIAGARRWIGIAAVAVIVQILLGGIVRHTKSASACRDLPFCAGQLWPTELHGSTRIHMLHRIVGVLVACIVIASAVIAYRRAQGRPLLRRQALLAPVLVLLQVTLGVLNVWLELPLYMVTLHLGGAALLFALHVWMWHTARGPAVVSAPERQTARPHALSAETAS